MTERRSERLALAVFVALTGIVVGLVVAMFLVG